MEKSYEWDSGYSAGYKLGKNAGYELGLEAAAKIIHDYRVATEPYATEPHGGYMKGLMRAEMLVMDGGHHAAP